MGKYLKQFRYYGTGSPFNHPSSISKTNLESGSIFFNQSNLSSIASLGIQAIPGFKFYLNDSVDPIIIGSTGIYELSLSENYEITSLKFDKEALKLVDDLSNSAYIIVDLVYNTEE